MSVRQQTGNRDGGKGSQSETDAGDDDRGHGADGDADTDLSDSDVFDVLRNSRRRVVISHLLDKGEPVSVRELTKQVAAGEYDVTVEEVSSDQHKRVYTGLYQCHLPRLDEFDVIDFDRDGKRVELSDAATQIEPYLDRHSDPTAHVEAVVTGLVAVVVVLGVAGVGPFGRVPVTLTAVLTVLALVGLAAIQLYE